MASTSSSTSADASNRLDKLLEPVLALDNVSDIHITEGQPIWARLNGALVALDTPNVSDAAIVGLIKHKAHETGVSYEAVEKSMAIKGDEDLGFSLSGSRLRANVFRSNGRQLSMTIRKIPSEAPQLELLGVPPSYVATVQQAKGLVLVTGSTGSGKSTTLASTISHLNNTLDGHIITIEDPIEYVIPSRRCLVHQRQIRRDTTDFKGSLRAAMRQDPDVILVGELRDQETVKTALDAANTGHLVFATLHTMSARQSIERLLSFFPTDAREYVNSVLSQVLLCVLSQSLLKSRDGKGRVLAAELLINTNAVRAAIRDSKPAALFNAMDTGAKEGQVLLNAALKELVRRQKVTREEALYYAYDPAGLMKELGGSR